MIKTQFVAAIGVALLLTFVLTPTGLRAESELNTAHWDWAELGFEHHLLGQSPDKSTSVPYTSTGQADFDIKKGFWTDMLVLTSADFDNDGNADLIYSGWIEDPYISFGSGDGTFQAPVLALEQRFSGAATGFVNSDEYIDVIAGGNDHVFILLNNGDGTFTSDTIGLPYSSLRGVETGYFNNDANLDFAITPGIIYFGAGDGTFPTSTTVPLTSFQGADVSDFDKDGDDDMVVLTNSSAHLLLNDGDGNFTKSDSIVMGQLALVVSTENALADFNHDGNPDFALITPLIGIQNCSAPGWLSVITVGFGDGAGGIMSSDTFSVCGTSYIMKTSDIDSDGELDVVIANASAKQLEIFYGDSTGSFSGPDTVDLETDSLTFVLAAGDFDSDGNPDFASGGGIVWGDSLIMAISNLPDLPQVGFGMEALGLDNVNMEVIDPENRMISRHYNVVAGAQHFRRDVNANGSVDDVIIDNSLIPGCYKFRFTGKANSLPGATFSAIAELGNGQTATFFLDHPIPALGSRSTGVPPEAYEIEFQLGCISPVQPVSGVPRGDRTPSFQWHNLIDDGASPDFYHFQLSERFDFSSGILVDESNLTDPTYTVGTALTTDAVYYWHIRSFEEGTWSEYSQTFAYYLTTFVCGNIDGIDGTGGPVDVADLTHLVGYLFLSGPPPTVLDAANVDGIEGPGGIVDVADLSYLVDYLFFSGPPPVCN